MKSSKNPKRSKADPLEKDLSGLFKKPGWKKVQYELMPKNKTITLRMNEEFLEAIKERAEAEGLDYQKWIRNSLEASLNKTA